MISTHYCFSNINYFGTFFWLSSKRMVPSSFLTSKTSFVIGWMSTWLELFSVPIRNLTDLTSLCLSGIFSMSRAIGHSFQFVLFVLKSTTSPTSVFSFKSLYFCQLCNVLKNSIFRLDQNLFARCWILLHRRWL